MNGILFSTDTQDQLLPLTFMKPAGELRIGVLTFRERLESLFNIQFSYLSPEYLQNKFPLNIEQVNLFYNATVFPHNSIIQKCEDLKNGEALYNNDILIAFKGSIEEFNTITLPDKVNYTGALLYIQRPYDLFLNNAEALKFDYQLITKNRQSAPIPNSVQVVGEKNIFIEEGATLNFCTLNATDGPIYIGRNAEVMEGVMVRGGLALCEGAKLNMGAKIYGATTIGPYCKIGGEVNNSIITGYSNKGHDGFLGNSVIGEWCNLGADTNNSNLKNNYGEVKLYNYVTNTFQKTGQQFCGLIMGDHSKSAINTQFNTGTVVGVFANIFNAGFPPNKIKSFSWGGNNDAIKFKMEAAFEVAERMMSRRKVELTSEDKLIIEHLYQKVGI